MYITRKLVALPLHVWQVTVSYLGPETVCLTEVSQGFLHLL
jgi:hypothetical protein